MSLRNVLDWTTRFIYRTGYTSSFAGMRGLSNFGLSCCVNALLQSFSATWELLHLLHDWQPQGAARDSVPVQLRNALEAMKNEPSQPAPHHNFLRCLDNNRIRFNVQHDADEVFLCILNLIQQQMDDKALALRIHQLFQIPVEMQVQCLSCSQIQARHSYLVNLPLSIRQGDCSLVHPLVAASETAEECMADFFAPQELRGADLCYCVCCEAKTPSIQGFRLRALPPLLCMQLKRFFSDRGATRKMADRVSFPDRLDVTEMLKRTAFSRDFAVAEGNSCYALYAVVVHSGSASCGHYTAYVRHQGGDSWYYANDSHVQQVSWADVQSSYGGGHSRGTAYMLLYRQQRPAEQELPDEHAHVHEHTHVHEHGPAVGAEEEN